MFTLKTQAEINAMTPEQVDTYSREKSVHDAETRKDEIELAIAEATKNNATKEEITSLKNELSDELVTLKGLMEVKNETKSFGSMSEAITHALESQKVSIQDAIAGKQNTPIKAVVTMQVDNTIGAGSTQVTITDNTGQITSIRRREERYFANVSVGRTNGNRALWIEQTAEDGTPIFLGEGDAKTQLSSIWQEKTKDVKKIAVYGKVTTELMADIPQLVSYIENDLMKRMDIVLENGLFTGDGIGDNLTGAVTYATAFTGGALAGSIDEANDYDVVEAVALQSEVAFGVPNAIFVNPAIVSRMKLTKGTDGHYVMPAFATASGLQVSGMKVIPTTAMVGENFLGGDLSVINVLIREELGIQIGLDGNDFTNNKKTMLIEKRLVQYVSANNTQVLIKGAFNTAKALLETA